MMIFGDYKPPHKNENNALRTQPTVNTKNATSLILFYHVINMCAGKLNININLVLSMI